MRINLSKERKGGMNQYYCLYVIYILAYSIESAVYTYVEEKTSAGNVERSKTSRERALYSCSIHSMHFPNSAIFSHAHSSPEVSAPFVLGRREKRRCLEKRTASDRYREKSRYWSSLAKYRQIGIFPTRLHEGSLIGFSRAATVDLINTASLSYRYWENTRRNIGVHRQRVSTRTPSCPGIEGKFFNKERSKLCNSIKRGRMVQKRKSRSIDVAKKSLACLFSFYLLLSALPL